MARKPRRPQVLRILAALVTSSLLGAPVVLAEGGGAVSGVVRANPLVVTLELSTTTAAVGQAIQARATVSNLGPTTIRGIRVELRVDPSGLRLVKAAIDLAQLKAGKSSTVTWAVCGRVVGSYVLLARATAGGASIDSQAQVLTISSGGRKTCP